MLSVGKLEGLGLCQGCDPGKPVCDRCSAAWARPTISEGSHCCPSRRSVSPNLPPTFLSLPGRSPRYALHGNTAELQCSVTTGNSNGAVSAGSLHIHGRWTETDDLAHLVRQRGRPHAGQDMGPMRGSPRDGGGVPDGDDWHSKLARTMAYHIAGLKGHHRTHLPHPLASVPNARLKLLFNKRRTCLRTLNCPKGMRECCKENRGCRTGRDVRTANKREVGEWKRKSIQYIPPRNIPEEEQLKRFEGSIGIANRSVSTLTLTV